MTEEERDAKHWQLLTSFLEKATPVAQVNFARWTNYTDEDILIWMIERPETDLAAALTIYFNMSPNYYAEKTMQELASYELETYELLEKIAKRVKENFYAPSDVYFLGTDFLDTKYVNQDALRPIAEHMMKAYKGSIIISHDFPEDFDEGLPIALCEEIWKLY